MLTPVSLSASWLYAATLPWPCEPPRGSRRLRGMRAALAAATSAEPAPVDRHGHGPNRPTPKQPGDRVRRAKRPGQSPLRRSAHSSRHSEVAEDSVRPRTARNAQEELLRPCFDAPCGSGQSHNNCGTERGHASPIRTPRQSVERCATSDLRVISPFESVSARAGLCRIVSFSREFATSSWRLDPTLCAACRCVH